VKVYVLGPPKDYNSFGITEKESEMYPEFAALDASQAFAAALKIGESGLTQEEENTIKRSFPFDQRYNLTAETGTDRTVLAGFLPPLLRFRQGISRRGREHPGGVSMATGWIPPGI